MTGDDLDPDLIGRLRAFGAERIAPDLDAQVRSRMTDTEPVSDAPVPLEHGRSARSKRRVAALVTAAVLATSGAAAATGSLPAPVQRSAHRVFHRVGVDVPDRPSPRPPTTEPTPQTTAPPAATTTVAPTSTTAPSSSTSSTPSTSTSTTTTTVAGSTSTTGPGRTTTTTVTEPSSTTAVRRPSGG